MLRFPLLALIFVLSASLAQAATFVGCVLAAEVALTGSGGAFVTSQAACNTRCTGRGAQYSYYTAGTIPTTNNCYCDNVNSYVAASAYAVGSGGTTCLATVQAVATDLATTFTFNGCVGTIVGVTVNLAQGTILGGSIVTGPQQCFQTCAGNLRAYVIPIVPSVTAILPSYGCVCDPSGQVTTGICGVGQFYGFQHPASASGQARKRQQQVLNDHADQRRRTAFCPKGMKACNIQGVDNSWEVGHHNLYSAFEVNRLSTYVLQYINSALILPQSWVSLHLVIIRTKYVE
uniref:Uncharacterized protein n=1 Tax=Kwoniella bestiolae CBS 10118 TaxID=1296100 RepID=A0A1B9G673_9TREE|nr:hypothetical protein I302_04187 [Kwoniella bestiolae CBS 10118]OCF26501.1 hypothetical protein I302_04187 [Kwoniella bestiolae CBS 10118]